MGKTLTEREQQVLALIATGKTSREIAAALRISVHTVNNHRRRIGKKFALHRSVALILSRPRRRAATDA